MSRYVLDTDMLTLYEEGHPGVVGRVASHAPQDLATTAITVEEQLTGWFTLLRRAKGPETTARAYRRLVQTVGFLGRMTVLEFTEAAIGRF